MRVTGYIPPFGLGMWNQQKIGTLELSMVDASNIQAYEEKFLKIAANFGPLVEFESDHSNRGSDEEKTTDYRR